MYVCIYVCIMYGHSVVHSAETRSGYHPYVVQPKAQLRGVLCGVCGANGTIATDL